MFFINFFIIFPLIICFLHYVFSDYKLTFKEFIKMYPISVVLSFLVFVTLSIYPFNTRVVVKQSQNLDKIDNEHYVQFHHDKNKVIFQYTDGNEPILKKVNSTEIVILVCNECTSPPQMIEQIRVPTNMFLKHLMNGYDYSENKYATYIVVSESHIKYVY